MKYKQYNAARDGNEKEIVACLKGNGLTVERLDQPLDLLVGYGGITILAEVKMPRNKRGDPKSYTDFQDKFLSTWLGGHTLLVTIEDAQRLAKRMKTMSRLMTEFASNSLQITQNNVEEKQRNRGSGKHVPSEHNNLNWRP